VLVGATSQNETDEVKHKSHDWCMFQLYSYLLLTGCLPLFSVCRSGLKACGAVGKVGSALKQKEPVINTRGEELADGLCRQYIVTCMSILGHATCWDMTAVRAAG
jgi:hypothetical protein